MCQCHQRSLQITVIGRRQFAISKVFSIFSETYCCLCEQRSSIYKYIKSRSNDFHNLSDNTHVLIKINGEFYHGIV